MKLSPDETIYWQNGYFVINATILWTWIIMLALVVISKLITRNLKTDITISRWQSTLEILVVGISNQIKEIGLQNPEKYIGFLGTLFIFIGTCNLCILFPFYEPPTSSLSTTIALALSVFVAVPFFGILEGGISGYLKSYLQPSIVVLPFNLIGDFSRTLALSVRLFGNIMSGGVILSILLSITPIFFPIIMNVLGMLTGIIQAYIFSILATVYIAAATQDSKININPNKKE